MTFGPAQSAGGQWPYSTAQHKAKPAVLIGVSVWRLVIVLFAFIGFGAAVARFGFAGAMPGLSQQASLFVGCAYLGLLFYPLFTGGRRHEPGSPWLRGALAVLLILVAGTFISLMGGDVGDPDSLFEHLLTPLVVVIDVLAVGRNQAAMRWWHPLTWLVFPAAYLVYYVLADLSLYGSFLDPSDSDFAVTVISFLAAVTVAGYVIYGAAKVKAAITASIHSGGQATGVAYQGQQYQPAPQPMPQPQGQAPENQAQSRQVWPPHMPQSAHQRQPQQVQAPGQQQRPGSPGGLPPRPPV